MMCIGTPPAERIGHRSQRRRRWRPENANDSQHACGEVLSCRKPGTRNTGRIPHDPSEVEAMGRWSPDRKPRAQGDPRVLRLGLRGAVLQEGTNPGRTANKAREHFRAVVAWAWEQDLIDSLPRFPKPRPQRDVAGRHYLTKAEINAIYFATHKMERPRSWNSATPIGPPVQLDSVHRNRAGNCGPMVPERMPLGGHPQRTTVGLRGASPRTVHLDETNGHE